MNDTSLFQSRTFFSVGQVRLCLLLLFLLLSPLSGYAQQPSNKVIIKVLDQATRQPLAYAHVILLDKKQQLQHTDIRGEAQVILPDSGMCDVRITFVGYIPYQGTLHKRQEKVEILLRPNQIELQQLQIEGTRARLTDTSSLNRLKQKYIQRRVDQ